MPSNRLIRLSHSLVDCLFSSLYVSFFESAPSPLIISLQVPETKGLSLEEMDEVFGARGLAAADLQRQAEISHRIGLSAYDDHPGASTEKFESDYKDDHA